MPATEQIGPWIEAWDSDHTALVHVLWAAEREGLTVKDADALAAKIMASKWMKAVRLHAAERAAAAGDRTRDDR